MDESRQALESLLRSRLAARGPIERGPRRGDLTLRLRRAEEIEAVASELCGMGFSLATLVATDEAATADRDLKVRTIFEPGSGSPDPLPDLFVTVVVSLDPAHPAMPSLAVRIPSANWHEREARDLFGIVFVGHPDPRPLVVHDGWPRGQYPLRKDFDARQRLPVEPAEEFPHLVVEGEGVAAAARRECVSEEGAGAVENRSIQASSWAMARGAPPQAKARIHLAAKEMGENGG